VRAVLDANVHISALLSAAGSPGRIVRAFVEGRFELVVSPKLLSELQRALGYAKLQRYIDAEESAQYIAWLRDAALLVEDPGGDPPARSADPEDDYLLALAASQQAHLVSGDRHLLQLADERPIHSPAEFLRRLDADQR
jgi:putative PIN family toxin of toxin-antitoxin system